jgi:hypothetical protein
MTISQVAEVSAQDVISSQKASARGLLIKVSIMYTPVDHRVLVRSVFTNSEGSNYNVQCLNVYRDFSYQLRDASGQLMHGDTEAWKKHLDTGSEQGLTVSCEKLSRIWPQKTSSAFLNYLYPNAAHGSYTLQMTFTPRDRAERVAFSPVTVNL